MLSHRNKGYEAVYMSNGRFKVRGDSPLSYLASFNQTREQITVKQLVGRRPAATFALHTLVTGVPEKQFEKSVGTTLSVVQEKQFEISVGHVDLTKEENVVFLDREGTVQTLGKRKERELETGRDEKDFSETEDDLEPDLKKTKVD